MSIIPFFITKPRTPFHDPFVMDIWDPFPHFHHENAISRPHFPLHNYKATLGATKVEWQETPEAHLLKSELPGFKKDEVKVAVEDGKLLKISGERKFEKEEKHENWYQFEASKGKFLQAFALPKNSKHEHIRSSFEDGALTVTVPKADVHNNYNVKKGIKG